MHNARLSRKNNVCWAKPLAVIMTCAAVWSMVACGAQHDPGDSSTHFWRTCADDEDCGDDYQCLCGRCTEECNRADDCNAPQAECVAAARLEECSLQGNVCAAPEASEEHADAGDEPSESTTTDNSASDAGGETTSDVAQTSDQGSAATSSSASDSTSTNSANSEGDSESDDGVVPSPFPWQPIIGVEPADTFAFAPLVTVDGEGTDMTLWTAGNAETGYSLTANTYRADFGWEDAVQLASGAEFLSRQCLASNPDGASIAAWVAESDTGQQLWAAVFEPDTGWAPSTALAAQAPQINDVNCTRDATGNAFIIWTPNDGTKATLSALRYEPAAGWSEPERLDQTDANASTLSLALDGAGNALVLWSAWQGDADELWSNRYLVSEGWQAPFRMPSTQGLRVVDVDLVLTEAGNGIGLWSEQADDGTQSAIRAIEFTSEGTWGEPEVLATGDALSNPSVGFTGHQTALATWEAFRSTDDVRENRIFAREKNESGWQEPVLLAEDAAWISLAVSPTGYAVAAWRTPLDYTVEGDVVVANYDHQTGWRDALSRLSENVPGDATSIYASVNDDGQACVVWQQTDGDEGGQILFSRTGAYDGD